jgi:hypothetical protein
MKQRFHIIFVLHWGFPVVKQRGVKLTTHCHLLPSLTMLGAIRPPPHTFTSWCPIKHTRTTKGEKSVLEMKTPNQRAMYQCLFCHCKFYLTPSSLSRSKNNLIINRLIPSWKFNFLENARKQRKRIYDEHSSGNRSSFLKVLYLIPFQAQWLLHVTKGFTFRNFTFCPQYTFTCFVWIS